MLKSKGKVFAVCLALQVVSGPAWGLLIRSNDGLNNSISNPGWGSTGSNLVRITPAAYDDGQSAPTLLGLWLSDSAKTRVYRRAAQIVHRHKQPG